MYKVYGTKIHVEEGCIDENEEKDIVGIPIIKNRL